ncbi:MAG: hypothetical protein EB075_14470 [Bacteroidetes bacterium]|nr:hypothetical protein [Bacteroidota bacterium]
MTQCSVCLDPRPDYKTECGHTFHTSCLQTWVLSEHRLKPYDQDLTCPNCRSGIDPFALLFGTFDATEALFGE